MEKLNVKGIIASDEPVEEWLDAIDAVGSGRLWFSARFPVRHLLRGTESDPQPLHLTPYIGSDVDPTSRRVLVDGMRWVKTH